MRPVLHARALRTLFIGLVASAGVTCRDAGPTGPGRIAPATARLAFASAFAAGAPDVPIVPYRKAHVELFTIPGNALARDTTITFVDGDTTSTFALGVTVTSPSQRFVLALALVDDQDRVLYTARDTVTAFVPGASAPPPPVAITLIYAGPDTAARTVAVAPRDTVLTAGAAVRFRAAARRADNSIVAGAVVGFSAGGTGITVDADGTVHATAAGPRGAAMVIARLATGVSDSTIVTVVGAPASIALSPDTATVMVGTTLQLAAVVRDAAGTVLVTPVTFASADTALAVVSPSGAVLAKAPGVALVTARAGAASATARLVVTAVPVARILLRPDTMVSLDVGAVFRFTAQALDANGGVLDRAITWTSSDPAVALVSRDSLGRGVVVGQRVGTATVTAAADGQSASVTVRVTVPRTPTILISPRGAALRTGDTLRFTAAVRDTLGQPSPTPPVWSVAGQSPVITVDAAGLVTARQSGTAMLVVSANGVADSVTLGVRTVAAIAITPSVTSVAAGARARFVATALDSAGAAIDNVMMAWSVADTSIALLDTASAQVAIVLARSPGSTAVAASAYGKTGSATLRVPAPRRASLVIQPRGAALRTGDTTRFSATVLDTLGQPSAAAPTWSVAGGSPVVTVDAATGLVQARRSGTATIIASALGAADSVTVTVRTVASIVIAPTSVTLATAGLRARYTAVARDSAGLAIDSVAMRWSLGAAGVARIDSVAPQALVVFGEAPGSTSVVATAYGVTGSASLIVQGPLPPVSITITPSSATLASLGQLVAMAATVRDAAGATVAATPAWTARDPSIATVDASGVVRAVGIGGTYVLATSGSLADSARVTVRQQVDTILVSRDTIRLALGDTATVVATPLDANRNPIGDVVATFASENAAVATVTAAGRVTLVASGTTRVIASAGGRTSAVVVMQGQGTGGVSASLAYIRVTPGAGSVRMGGTLPLVAELVDANGTASALAPAWASDQPGRAPVSSAGVVTLVDTGTVTITATAQGIAGHASFTVLPAPVVTSFVFAPTTLAGVSTSTVTFSVSVGAADPGTGIGAVQVEFTGPTGDIRTCSVSAPIVGTSRRGTWDCAISLPAGSAAGTWRATRVSLAGTITRAVTESQLAAFGTTTLTVVP